MFSTRLKEAREVMEYSQKDVAEMIGMSQSGYSKMENGQREPSLKYLIKLTEVLNVTADYLLGIEKKVSKEEPRNVRITIDGIEIDIQVNKKEPSSKNEDSSTD